MSNAVAKKPEGGLPATRTGVPRGLENFDKKDLQLPHVSLMQGLSKLVTRGGKKPGTFVNTLTKADLGTSFDFIPVSVSKYWDLLKADPAKPGEFIFDKRTYDENDPRLEGRRFFNDKEKGLKANCNAVISFLILVDGEPALLKFSKTAYKTGKSLGTMAMMSGKDLFATVYKVTSKPETRGENDYFNMDVVEVGAASEADYKVAEKLYESFGKRINAIVDKAVDAEESAAHDHSGGAAETPAETEKPGATDTFEESAPATPQFTKVRVLKTVRTDEEKKCPQCSEVRAVKDGKVQTNDPETNLPWGKVKALVCKKCNKVDVIEKLAD